jgi:hypothetical protein
LHALHLLRSQHRQHLLHLLRSLHQQHLLRSQHRLQRLLLLYRAHQLFALRQVVVQFLLRLAAAAQFRLHLVALVVPVIQVQVVLHSRDQLALQLVVQVAVQVHAPAVCLALHLVEALLAQAVLCVLRLRAALVRVVQVLVLVVQAAVLHLVVALVRVDQALVQEHVRVVPVLVVRVVQVAAVRVAQVAVNVALQKRNLVHVVVKTSTKCCRRLQRVTQQVTQPFLRASSSSSAVHLRKSLLLN